MVSFFSNLPVFQYAVMSKKLFLHGNCARYTRVTKGLETFSWTYLPEIFKAGLIGLCFWAQFWLWIPNNDNTPPSSYSTTKLLLLNKTCQLNYCSMHDSLLAVSLPHLLLSMNVSSDGSCFILERDKLYNINTLVLVKFSCIKRLFQTGQLFLRCEG